MCLLLLEASLYPFSDNFVCFDGSATISFENINDDYCDCRDGSDEPGLSLQCAICSLCFWVLLHLCSHIVIKYCTQDRHPIIFTYLIMIIRLHVQLLWRRCDNECKEYAVISEASFSHGTSYSVEDDVDVWGYTIVSCMPETTTTNYNWTKHEQHTKLLNGSWHGDADVFVRPTLSLHNHQHITYLLICLRWHKNGTMILCCKI